MTTTKARHGSFFGIALQLQKREISEVRKRATIDSGVWKMNEAPLRGNSFVKKGGKNRWDCVSGVGRTNIGFLCSN
jgi:hypothetical protein